ncbi:minor histocompatibility antigen H13-like [Plectropomus leopardus]|uniref:minor histocompatibility antigen H13-like n=1 Tax=Plectropomus leopardus TaxID=160734 RepID=UPI001C4B6C4A|nr:minor histocompatibility antigen H13-like [Plectropomus leopardus]
MSEAEPVPAAAPEAAVLDALNATDSNGTEALNATAKFVATPEGTALAYGSLVFMALLPIFFGALRSVSCSKSKELGDNDYDSGFRVSMRAAESTKYTQTARCLFT